MKTRKQVFALLLALLCLAGCGGAKRLTESVRPAPAEAGMEAGDAAALAGFSLELLKENWTGENLLVSPCRSSAPWG